MFAYFDCAPQFNLGWKLALVEKGHARETLLDTYAEERLPIIAEMLNKTTELLKHSPLAGKAAPPRAKTDNIRADMSQLGVTYRGSSIIQREASVDGSMIGYNKGSVDAAQPGDRAPEAPGLTDISGNTFSVYNLLSPCHHTVIIFSDGYSGEDLDLISELIRQQPVDTIHMYSVLIQSAQTTSEISKLGKQLIDENGHAHTTYKVDGPCIVIVRPDGVIGARVVGPSGLAQYFKTIFNN